MAGLRDAGLAALRGIVERSSERVDAAARDRIHSVITAEVEAAYNELLALLQSDDYAEHAPDAVGLSSYPGGAEIYDELVKLHTTLDLTPHRVPRCEPSLVVSGNCVQQLGRRLSLGIAAMPEGSTWSVMSRQPSVTAEFPQGPRHSTVGIAGEPAGAKRLDLGPEAYERYRHR